MDYWKRFLKTDNFLLAWRRINTGNNIYYKRLFRDVYLAYEVALDENIESLISRIKGETYEPRHPDKIFLPKPSGLQRPITLLTVEDQLVWQAIANILELKWQEKRALLERKIAFSNISSPTKIFFFEHWKASYTRFISHIKQVYKNKKWAAHFDLAAYFDTISHDHIVKLISPRNDNSPIASLIKCVLSCWTSEKSSSTISHGIPQGPIASSYMGELVFYDIDNSIVKLSLNKFTYMRYVDDIRLFANEEDGTRDGVVKLEQLCRNKGLIPQSSKTAVFYAENEEAAVGKHFSIAAETYDDDEKSEKILLDSLTKDLKKIENISKFKFFLYKGSPLPKYLDAILNLFEKHPDISDAFVNYFSKFEDNNKVINHLSSMLRTKYFPYEYVEGNIWLLLAMIDKSRKSRSLIIKAKKKILNPKINFYLRYGLLMYLCPFGDKYGKRMLNRYLFENSSLLQSLVLPSASSGLSHDNYLLLLKKALGRTSPDAGLVASTLLAYNNIELKDLNLDKKIVSAPVKNCLVGLGLAKSHSMANASPFQEIFKKRYQIDIADWKDYLGAEYTHAYRILILAEKAFEINKSSWLCYTDSFNEIIARALIRLDSIIKQPLFDTAGKLVKYGVLLNPANDFCKKYISISSAFRTAHKRRCSVPEAHPYDEKTAARARPLRPGERNNIFGSLKKVYIEVDAEFAKLKP